jgi:hypothetical protein
MLQPRSAPKPLAGARGSLPDVVQAVIAVVAHDDASAAISHSAKRGYSPWQIILRDIHPASASAAAKI